MDVDHMSTSSSSSSWFKAGVQTQERQGHCRNSSYGCSEALVKYVDNDGGWWSSGLGGWHPSSGGSELIPVYGKCASRAMSQPRRLLPWSFHPVVNH
eukprot:scaffold236_cov419-Prasinococcus_capsulatus_cf.AAC.14